MNTIVSWLRTHKYGLGISMCLIALLAKFLTPLFLFDIPLGYDPGMYRYLFLQYAQSLSSFSFPELLPWATEHPSGLFVLASPFIIAGFPVDALIGWMWNLFPVILISVFSVIMTKREGRAVGVCVLLIGVLSQAFFDGFFAMYMKAYVALLLTIITYFLAEKKSIWFVLTALAAVMIHQQTGLILTLSLGIWWLCSIKNNWSDPKYRRITYILSFAAVVALLWYIPQWERAIWSPLKSIFLLRGENAPAGAFPDANFYVRTMGVVLLLGIFGLILSTKKDKGSLWQLSVLVCAVFIVFKLVFYKRFYLQLDFFLMPFAAIALVWIWNTASAYWSRGLLIMVLVAQTVIGFQAMKLRAPRFSARELAQITALSNIIEPEASVIALENISGTWLRGWLPYRQVGAPGLFDYPNWSYEQWETFIDGTQKDRKALLSELHAPVYFLLSPTFTRFYGDRAQNIITDPCLSIIEDAPLLKSLCSKD